MVSKQQESQKGKKAKDDRPSRRRYTLARRWLTNKARAMVRTARAQPRNAQVRERLRALAKVEPIHFPHESKIPKLEVS